MSLDMDQALREGYERTIANNGLILAAAFFVLNAVNALVTIGSGPRYSAMRVDLFGRPADPILAPFLPPPVAGLLSLVAGLATMVVAIAALRTFVTDETEQLPEDHFTRRIVWAFLNVLVGTIIFAVVVAIGLVFLVIPGLFLLVSLVFWEVYVAVEDDNFVDAFGHSWRLVRGHRWELFGLGFVVLLIALIVNAAFGIPGALVGGPGGLLVAQSGSALTTVFATAVLARAYVQLREAEADAASDAPGATGEPTAWTTDASAPDEAGAPDGSA